jgi:hypothetical protein
MCLLIALNLHAHYYYVCTVPPGFVEDPSREEGSSIFWAKKKPLRGVRWSDTLKITAAAVTKCKKCGQAKPEVSAVLAWKMKADEFLSAILRGLIIVVYATAVFSSSIITVRRVFAALFFVVTSADMLSSVYVLFDTCHPLLSLKTCVQG